MLCLNFKFYLHYFKSILSKIPITNRFSLELRDRAILNQSGFSLKGNKQATTNPN